MTTYATLPPPSVPALVERVSDRAPVPQPQPVEERRTEPAAVDEPQRSRRRRPSSQPKRKRFDGPQPPQLRTQSKRAYGHARWLPAGR